MNTSTKCEFKTFEFENNAGGQAEKLKTVSRLEEQGWEVVSEAIQPGQFDGGKACCSFLICAPLAFLGYQNGRIVVSMRRPKA